MYTNTYYYGRLLLFDVKTTDVIFMKLLHAYVVHI